MLVVDDVLLLVLPATVPVVAGAFVAFLQLTLLLLQDLLLPGFVSLLFLQLLIFPLLLLFRLLALSVLLLVQFQALLLMPLFQLLIHRMRGWRARRRRLVVTIRGWLRSRPSAVF